MFMRMPVSEAFIMGQTSTEQCSTYGIYYFAMQESGVVFAPIMGNFLDHFGFHSSFTMAGAAAVIVTFICSFFLRGSQD